VYVAGTIRIEEFSRGTFRVGCSERRKEIKRRRHRRQKLSHLSKRLTKATVSERGEIVRKIRELTPGADRIIRQWELTEDDR